ncbi:MAG: hypothetical protein SNJ71_02070, partial [Bacteroidales bacterium]
FRSFSSKITEWVTAKYKNKWKCFLCNHNYVKSSYALDGSTTSTYGDIVFHGAFASAGMVDKKYQKWVDDGYNIITYSKYSVVTYYNACLRVMYSLYLTGNMPNLWEMDK